MADAYHSNMAQGKESIPVNKLESRDHQEHASSGTQGTVPGHHAVSGTYAPYVEDLM